MVIRGLERKTQDMGMFSLVKTTVQGVIIAVFQYQKGSYMGSGAELIQKTSQENMFKLQGSTLWHQVYISHGKS